MNLMHTVFGHPQAKLTLSELLPEYARYAQLRGGSANRYRCEVGRWDRLVGNVPVGQITTEHFLQFRNACVSLKLQNSSTESTVRAVKAMMRYCRDRGWLQALPAWGKPLRVVPPNPTPATLEEIDKLYKACDRAVHNGRGRISPCDWWQAWLTVGYFTGLRLSDLTYRLRFEHVFPDRIEFRAQKTDRMHVFPMVEPVRRALDVMSRTVTDGLVFGGGMAPRVQNALREFSEAAGIRQIGAQMIRQASVTGWLMASETAGKLVHGVGLPGVLDHYAGVLQILSEAAPRFPWPQSMLAE